MSGLIKQQISKRLSKFTKNLSTHQISLSAMKGEGDLTNLELDEVVLMDLLGAPSWMKLTRAFCNRLTIKVQWTKLSSQPIVLILDEVNIDIETCDSRDQSTENTFLSHSPGKYGYTDQIMDGISLSINVININFRSSSFRATFQMSRVTIESRTPIWQVGSLDRTRIKNDLRGEVIIFKEVQWQAVRIEANALTDWIMTTPLRLIANQSKIRITIKKRMSDCGIICTKVEVNMDDILWVLTDSQVFAAMTFVDDLRNIILNNQSNQVRPPSKSQSNNSISKSPSAPHKALSQRQMDLEKFFDKFNESSYHFFSGRIELHLCDDISQENSSYRCRVEGGAMQLVLNQLEFSYYPLRPAASSRQEWPRYNDCNAAVERWTKSLLSNYLKNPDVIGWHLERFSKDVKQELMESCTVLRLKDLCLYCVSSSKDCKKSKPRKFFCSDKRRLLLPDDMPVFHVEFTDYYNCPIPSSLHVTVNPVCLSIHHPSLLWINVFCLNVMKKSEILPERKSSMKQIDTKMDVLMPRITLPASEIQENGKDEELLQIHSSKLLITNLFADDSSQKNSTRILASQFQAYKSSKFCNSGFRCRGSTEEEGRSGSKETSAPPLRLPHGFVDTITKSTTHLKKQDDDEMWCVICDQFWIDFLTPNKHSSHPQGRKFKTQNFLEAFPFTTWLLMSPVKEITHAEAGRPKIEQEVTCLTCIDVSVKVILDCQQLNFLTRLVSLASKTWDEKIYDTYRIGLSLPTVETMTKFLLLLPSIELCFILPSSLMAASSSTSIPCISSSSSSSLSLSNRVAEHQNGPKHNNAIASNDDQPKSHSSKMISKDDLMINGGEIKQTNRSRVEPGINHHLEISSFESMRKQTKDTMSTMLYGLSNKFKGSDSSIHDHMDDEDWITMFHNQPEIPAFEKPKEICDDNDFDDVISDSSSNKKKVISILRVGLRSLEMLMQMNELNMEVMMMIDNISTEEVDKINYEKFKTTYLLASNESIPLYHPSTDKSVEESDFLKFHYEIARLPEITNFKDNVRLEVQNGKLKLKTSTLMKFVKVFEGNDTAATDGPALELLMYVLMKNVSIDIMDKNSEYKISVDSLQISKGEDGIIRIGNEISSKDVNMEHTIQEEREFSQDESELEHENETLKKQLEKLGRLTMSDGFDDLKQWRKKCQKLESDVKDMDSQVKRLSAERDSLLRLVDTLQSALESSEKMRSKHA